MKVQPEQTALEVVDQSSSPVAVVTSAAFIPTTFEQALELSERLSKSELLPPHFQGKEANIFWAIAYGADLGFSPVQALQNIFVINGRPGLYAEAMQARVLSSPLCEYFECIESTETRATFATRRRGRKEQRKTFTIEMAQKRGYLEPKKTRNGGTITSKYITEPEAMLEARAKSWLARLVYPDLLRGLSSVEELETIDLVETEDGTYSAPVAPAPRDVSSEPRGDASPRERHEAAVAAGVTITEEEGHAEKLSEVDQLRAEIAAGNLSKEVRARCLALPRGPERNELSDRWVAKEDELRAAKAAPDPDDEAESLRKAIEAGNTGDDIKARILKLPDDLRIKLAKLFDEQRGGQ